MDLGLPLFLALLAGIIAVPVAEDWRSVEGRWYRRIRRTRRCPIFDAEDGSWVKLEGIIELEEPPLTAPLTGRACALYRASVFEGAKRLALEDRVVSRAGWDGSSSSLGFLVRESVVEVGAQLVVFGRVRREPDPHAVGSYRAAATRVVVEGAPWLSNADWAFTGRGRPSG
jgi:hypothetical protein